MVEVHQEDNTPYRPHQPCPSDKATIHTILRDIDGEPDCETDIRFALTDAGLVVELVDGDGEVINSLNWSAQEFYDQVFDHFSPYC